MSGRPVNVLIVDDEEHIRRASVQTLELAGLAAGALDNAEAALERIAKSFPGVLVTDIRMPGMDGMQLLERALAIDPELPVILVTGHGDIRLAVEAMQAGAYDFIEKPYDSTAFAKTIARALEKRALVLENRRLREAIARRADDVEERLSGRSDAMVALRYQVRAIAATAADVLIVGATGTGKEVVARAVHDLSGRPDRPFVAINSAALPAGLIESELFGHEAGAFAGAMRARAGKFEHARGGTVFLDEIDSMPLELQAKLLRVIQERAVVRLGTNEPIPLNVRFIAASKIDLEEAAAAGRFRQDLLFRLNVATLRVPPLSERQQDIPALFVLLVREAAARYRVEPPAIEAAQLASLAARDWPGNVRQLRNAAERLVLGLQDGAAASARPGEGLAEQMTAFERSAITATLVANQGRLRPTYEQLGISRKTLYERMQRLGIDKADFRED